MKQLQHVVAGLEEKARVQEQLERWVALEREREREHRNTVVAPVYLTLTNNSISSRRDLFWEKYGSACVGNGSQSHNPDLGALEPVLLEYYRL